MVERYVQAKPMHKMHSKKIALRGVFMFDGCLAWYRAFPKME